MSKTKTVLVDDLRLKPEGPLRDYIVQQALNGYYHDFETTITFPKLQLSADLLQAGFDDLAEKVRKGDYD